MFWLYFRNIIKQQMIPVHHFIINSPRAFVAESAIFWNASKYAVTARIVALKKFIIKSHDFIHLSLYRILDKYLNKIMKSALLSIKTRYDQKVTDIFKYRWLYKADFHKKICCWYICFWQRLTLVDNLIVYFIFKSREGYNVFWQIFILKKID